MMQSREMTPQSPALSIITRILVCGAMWSLLPVQAGTTPPPDAAASGADAVEPSSSGTFDPAESVVRVNSTNQPHQFTRPWAKQSPFTRRGIGVLIGPGRVLVTAELVADASYVELELPKGSEKSPADVTLVDYDANLAIITPKDPEFLASRHPVEPGTGLTVGDKVEILQLEPNGAPALTPGTITTATVGSYPEDGVGLLLYKASAPIQYRENSFTLPAFSSDRLAGLLMRYDSRSQSAEIIPDHVIRAFLERASDENYQSFPRIGVTVAATRDPEFRKYLDLDNGETGIFISGVLPGSAAEAAGVLEGDVLLQVGPHIVDPDGNFEHTDYGLISFSHYISTELKPGDPLPVRLLRDGEEIEITIPLQPRDPSAIISEAQIRDQPPRYFVLGGLVFQELSRPFLREWGPDWQENAPQHLVYLDLFQDELPRDRGKIVFLSQVLPSEATIGYENLSGLVVEKINGRPIHSLEDVEAATAKPIDGFQRLELEADPGIIILDAAMIEAEAEELQSAYGLPSLKNLAPIRH